MSTANDSQDCPFCHTFDNCLHLLLLVDKTFRTAEGGTLMEAFNHRWYEIREEYVDDHNFDEKEAFDELIDDVSYASDVIKEYEHEGGPGNSSTYQIFFCETPAKIQVAQSLFQST